MENKITNDWLIKNIVHLSLNFITWRKIVLGGVCKFFKFGA
jgi:hypothetical protein